MSLTRKQMMEIVAFDWKRRTGLDFDGRRYGSITGAHAPHITETWGLCHGSHVFKGKKNPPRKTLRYNYIVPERVNGNRVTASGKPVRPDVTVVHVAVRLDGNYRPVVKDVFRWHIKTNSCEFRDIDYHGLGGWIVEWQREDWAGKKKGCKRLTPRLARPVDDGWGHNGMKWKFNVGLTFPWHETVNPDALKGTKYEWCQYSDSAPCKAGLVDWLMLYSQEPKIELLAKMGLHRLICPAGIKALQDRRVRDWILAHREEAAKRYKDGTPRYDMVDIIYAARHGVTIGAAEKRRCFIQDMRQHLDLWPSTEKVRLDYDRLMKLFRKWRISAPEYGRYLKYALRTGHDLKNEGTLYPPVRGGREAFMVRLEALEALSAKLERAEERRRRRQARMAEAERKAAIEAEERRIAEMMKARMTELEAFQKSLKRSATLKGCGYAIILAKSQEELRVEGKRMGNCVGMGTYGRAIVTGDALIIMLMRDGKSYCDIEIGRKKWNVRQCYLERNQRAPEEIHELAKRIAACLKAEYLRFKKRKAQERKVA